ncbi:MAG: EutN/CcmL family microcompartment protein [Actinobacteria bacterium]|nr:EutN/CcmL family microcompartment protein [Actinomycetota bacterium]
MIFGKIVGTVVSTQIDEGIRGKKCLLVQTCNYKGEVNNNYLVAVDLVGAGVEEVVIISQGSSARQTEITHQKPVDCIIVGIVDMVEEYNKIVFKK